MFKYESRYLHPVKVDKPNPNYATLLQEQLGGPQGELKAAMNTSHKVFEYETKKFVIYSSISQLRNFVI